MELTKAIKYAYKYPDGSYFESASEYNTCKTWNLCDAKLGNSIDSWSWEEDEDEGTIVPVLVTCGELSEKQIKEKFKVVSGREREILDAMRDEDRYYMAEDVHAEDSEMQSLLKSNLVTTENYYSYKKNCPFILVELGQATKLLRLLIAIDEAEQ